MVGAGNGLLVSQLGNVIMSSVPAERGSEAGGLQGTAMNLGASLGVALIGSILIASLVSNFQTNVLSDPALADISQELSAQAEVSANFVTVEQVTAAAEQAGLSAGTGGCRYRTICQMLRSWPLKQHLQRLPYSHSSHFGTLAHCQREQTEQHKPLYLRKPNHLWRIDL